MVSGHQGNGAGSHGWLPHRAPPLSWQPWRRAPGRPPAVATTWSKVPDNAQAGNSPRSAPAPPRRPLGDKFS